MTVKEEFKDLVRFARNNDDSNLICYLSGSKKKKTMMLDMLAKFKDDAELDHELGVLTDDEYEREKVVASTIERCISNYNVY